MIPVMIVEDEPVIRESMRKHIPWADCGFQVEAEAGNGLEALEYLNKNHIEIVFLDIQMPEMGGLELLAIIADKFPHVSVVIVSGFSDFNFVQAALRLKAVDYLLKPVDLQDVIRLLEKIKKKRETDTENHKGTIQAMAVQFVEMGLFKWINAEYVHEDLSSFPQTIAQSFPRMSFQFLLLAPRKGDRWMADEVKQRLFEPLVQILGNETTIYLAEKQRIGLVVLIVSNSITTHRDESSAEAIMDVMNDAKAILYSDILRNQNLHLYNAVLREAAHLQGCLFYNGQQMFHLKSFPVNNYQELQLSESWESEFIEAVRSHHPGTVRAKLSELFFKLSSESCYTPESVYKYYVNLLLKAAAVLRESAHDDIVSQESVARAVQSILEASHLRALHRMMGVILGGMIETYHFLFQGSTRKIVKEIIKYVDEHIHEDIVFTDLADQFSVSRQHLSRLFRNEKRMTFNQYLKEMRISSAIRILKQNYSVKNYELAQMVGYTDPKHFSKVFKEVTGVSPKEYMNHLL